MRHAATALALLTAVAAAAGPAGAADTEVGVRVGYYADAGKPFLGGELLVRVAPRLQVAPNVEVLLVDEGHSLTVNADALFDLTCSCNPRNVIWAGAGLGAAVHGGGGTDTRTDLGLNLMTGVSVRMGRALPYAQLKAIVRRHPELAVAVGLRF